MNVQRLGYRPDPPHRRTQRLSRVLLGSAPSPPYAASLERFEAPCLDQGQTGSCVGHGTSQAVLISCASEGEPLGFVPSAWTTYAVARTLEKRSAKDPLVDEGAIPADAERALSTFGVQPMRVALTPDGRRSDVWGPDDAPNPNVNEEVDLGDLLVAGQKLILGVYRVDENDPTFLEQVKRAIAAGYAVGIGVFVDSAFFAMKAPCTGVNFADPSGGGHWICLDAYSGDVFSGPNSWGLSYGFGPLVDAACPNKGGHWRATSSWMLQQAARSMDVYVFKCVPAKSTLEEVTP